MGIVIRQSLLSSAASYLGVAIGFVNAVILMPKFMTPDQIGLFRTLLSAALLLSSFGRFGINSGLIRFKSLLKTSTNRSQIFIRIRYFDSVLFDSLFFNHLNHFSQFMG